MAKKGIGARLQTVKIVADVANDSPKEDSMNGEGQQDPTVQDPTVEVEDVEDEELETVEPDGRPIIPATVIYGLSEEVLEKALADGDLRHVGTVKLTITKKESGTGRDEVQPYEKMRALTFEGMVLLSGGKAEHSEPRGNTKEKDKRSEEGKRKGAPDHFNYGLDLEVKRELRRNLESEIAGPAKAIEKMAKAMVENKLAKSLPEAIAKVKAMRLAEGLDG
jgi:hypothetical protein